MAISTGGGAKLEAQQLSQPADDDLIFTVFLAAMSRPEPERGQFVHEACSGDAALMAEVQRRVEWEQRMKGFLLIPIVPRQVDDHLLAPGDTLLRRFRIIRLAGQGGMGVVYEALDEKLGQRVALKFPRFEFRKRLSAEAMKSLRVAHPNVCRVFDFHTEETETGEMDFLTMEFLVGETLAAYMPQAPSRWLTTPEGNEIARQLCSGLSAIHATGIVHRDLKANNVMLSADDAGKIRAVIMDFGIAQTDDIFSSQARGTPAYLAPEIWKGQTANVQSDLYSLGVLLYEMACGHKPFPEQTSWRERMQTPPPPLPIREPVRSAVLRCLAPTPELRFRSVDEFEHALRRVSRRVLMAATISLAATAFAGVYVEQRFWPSSPVRLAILPPTITGGQSADAGLIQGFVQDLSYRLKTLRTQRRLFVFSKEDIRSEGATTPAQAHSTLGATHALSAAFKRNVSGWTISADLADAFSGGSIRRWDFTSTDSGLAAELFQMQSTVVRQIAQNLSLQAVPGRPSLPATVYADYLNGIYYALTDYEKAVQGIPYFEKVIAAAPDSALGYAGLAEALLGALYATGNRTYGEEAQEALAKAEQLDPELAQIYLIKGRLENKNGYYEQALSDCRRATELDEHDAQAWISVGYALLYRARYKEAQAAFQAAVTAQPGYYKPYVDLGLSYHQNGEIPGAEKSWLEAVRLAPGQTRSRTNLASLYLETGRLPEAEAQIRTSLSLRKTSVAFELQGDLFDLAGRYQDAVTSYEEAVRVGPPYFKIWAALASAYRKVGRENDALQTSRRGLEAVESRLQANGRDPELHAWAAFYHASLNEADRARTRAQETLALANPPVAMVRKRLVHTYDLLHDTEAALRLIDGAPADVRKALARDTGLSVALRQSPDFLRLTH